MRGGRDQPDDKSQNFDGGSGEPNGWRDRWTVADVAQIQQHGYLEMQAAGRVQVPSPLGVLLQRQIRLQGREQVMTQVLRPAVAQVRELVPALGCVSLQGCVGRSNVDPNIHRR